MSTTHVKPELASLFPKHKCGLHLTHNQHLDYYQSVEEYLKDERTGGWKDEESKLRAIATNELWELQWSPDTPAGSHKLYSPTLEELLEFANPQDDRPITDQDQGDFD